MATEKKSKRWQAKMKVLADWIRMMDECPDEWDGVGPQVIGMLVTPPGTQKVSNCLIIQLALLAFLWFQVIP